MYLSIIKNFINKFKTKKRRKNIKNKLLLNKIEQTSFIKKRKTIKFNNINFKKLNLFWKNHFYNYLLILFILISLIIFFIFWSTFKIKFIEIIKQDNITNMSIAYNATDKYRNVSIFNIKENEILKRLKEYQQNIKKIDIRIKLPNTLKINISSYKWLFNTKINEKNYIITENGTLVPSNYSDSLKELVLVQKFDKNKFIDYKKILDPTFINNIKLIVDSIKENIIKINISEIKYYITEREVHLKTDKKTILIFNLNSNIKEQIEKIAILNKEHININKNSIVYIDLRVKNKVFYCTTEKEYQCYQNLKSIYSDK